MTLPLADRLAREVVFVLVQPQQPGNVGGVVRAMANFGLRRLVIVDPAPSFDPERVRWMAPGAHDLVGELELVSTLDEALVGVHRLLGTTARHRRHGQTVLEPDQAAEALLDDPGRVTAVLFGREDLGLPAEATNRCEALIRIPTAEHASLNLAMAATVIAHRIFEAARAEGLPAPGRVVAGRRAERTTASLDRHVRPNDPADLLTLEPAVVEAVALLNRVGHKRARRPEQLAVVLREALQRARLSNGQVGSVRGMVHRINFALDHPEIPWRASRRQMEALRALHARVAEE
ncbi:MAG: hypothetical protein H6732_15995 [Alphaproteobacteria bacterium]|nr:hypothetical protein [Alphaproteobacteria bacterium]